MCMHRQLAEGRVVLEEHSRFTLCVHVKDVAKGLSPYESNQVWW